MVGERGERASGGLIRPSGPSFAHVAPRNAAAKADRCERFGRACTVLDEPMFCYGRRGRFRPIQVQCVDGVVALYPYDIVSRCPRCRKGYPDDTTKSAQEIRMMAFYLTLLALGAAGAVAIRELAVAQARQRAALRPVRIDSANRQTGRNARRG